MIRTLRAFFLGRLLREKLLLVAFALLGVGIWLSSFASRAAAFSRQQHNTTQSLREQTQWLTSEAAIQSAVDRAASRLDPAKTLDGIRLTTEVSNLAAQAGVRSNAVGEPPTTTTSGQFAIHTLNYTVRNADYLALMKFYVSLRDKSPYIGIDQFTLSVNANNRAQHNLQLRVSSVEINR